MKYKIQFHCYHDYVVKITRSDLDPKYYFGTLFIDSTKKHSKYGDTPHEVFKLLFEGSNHITRKTADDYWAKAGFPITIKATESVKPVVNEPPEPSMPPHEFGLVLARHGEHPYDLEKRQRARTVRNECGRLVAKYFLPKLGRMIRYSSKRSTLLPGTFNIAVQQMTAPTNSPWKIVHKP